MTQQQDIVYSKHNQKDISTSQIVYKMQMHSAQDKNTMKCKKQRLKTLSFEQVRIDKMAATWTENRYITNMTQEETVPIIPIY